MTDDQDTVEDRLNELENRVTGLEHDVKKQAEFAKTAQNTAEKALQKADNDDVREELQTLRQQLDQIEDRTDLLQQVKKASALTKTEQAAVCLQTLVTEAQNTNQRASMDVREATKTLGGGVDRTNMYNVLPHAAELIDDEDTVWYKRESRGSDKNSRLIVDLTQGDVPAQVEGYDLTGGGEV